MKRIDHQYLVRFDDVCPTMNWHVWDEIEAALVRYEVKPIIAVVPDNRDPKLKVGPPLPEFWDRVRNWQARGWAIAMHGYQHVYVNHNPGMLGLNRQSEFAGLPRAEQEDKLRKGLAIFREQGVKADLWVAPAHAFDATTVACLKDLGLTVISDGLWKRPFRDSAGLHWVPQQLWGFRSMPEGVWTVCLHPNPWDRADLDQFLGALSLYHARITALPQILERYWHRRRTLGDVWRAFFTLHWTFRLRPAIIGLMRRTLPLPERYR